MSEDLVIELASANMRVVKALEELRAAERAAKEVENKIQEAKPQRDFQAEIEGVKATFDWMHSEKRDLAVAKLQAEEVMAKFEGEPDPNTDWFELVESDSFSRPVRNYLRPATKTEFATLKDVAKVNDYRHQLQDLI